MLFDLGVRSTLEPPSDCHRRPGGAWKAAASVGSWSKTHWHGQLQTWGELTSSPGWSRELFVGHLRHRIGQDGMLCPCNRHARVPRRLSSQESQNGWGRGPASCKVLIGTTLPLTVRTCSDPMLVLACSFLLQEPSRGLGAGARSTEVPNKYQLGWMLEARQTSQHEKHVACRGNCCISGNNCHSLALAPGGVSTASTELTRP